MARAWAGALSLACVLAITAIVYRPVLRGQFTNWDDDQHLTNDPLFNPPSPEYFARFWREPALGLYVPLTYTVWELIGLATMPNRLLGPNRFLHPAVFHGANYVGHILTTAAVWLLLRQLLSSRRGPSIGDSDRREIAPDLLAVSFGTLLFALHPIQVEAVAWVSAFRDVLSGLFCAVALWQYVAFIRTELDESSPARAGGAASGAIEIPMGSVHYAGMVLASAAAMLSKPNAAALPLMMIVLDTCWLRRPLKRVMMTVAPVLALAIACAVVTRLVQPSIDVPPIAWYLRPFVAGDALAFYLWKLVVPVHFVTDYGRTPPSIMHGTAYLTSLIPLGVAAVLWWWSVRSKSDWSAVGRRVTAGLLAAAVAFLPVLGLVPFDFQTRSTVTDHYAYLPMMGVAAAVAAVIAAMRSDGHAVRGWGVGLVMLVLVSLAVPLARRQIAVWHDSRSLWTHQLKFNPHSWTGQNNMACTELDDGNFVAAERHARLGIRIARQNMDAYLNLGIALAGQSRMKEALAVFRLAVHRWPDESDTHAGLAGALYKDKRLAQAAAEYKLAIHAPHGTPNYVAEKMYALVLADLERPATSRALGAPGQRPTTAARVRGVPASP